MNSASVAMEQPVSKLQRRRHSDHRRGQMHSACSAIEPCVPKCKHPPSDVTSQYPLSVSVADIPTTG